jgi:hypothetical protein
VDKGKLYVADKILPTVYQVDVAATTTNAQSTVSMTEVGKGNQILGLTVSDGTVYALQFGDVPLAKVVPSYKPVSLTTAWGFMLDNNNHGTEPFFQFNNGLPVGFAASPSEERKLYISHPNLTVQSIVSVKDYDFDQWWTGHSSVDGNRVPTDFNYPVAKPPKTFRILITGESRVFCATSLKIGQKASDPGLNPYLDTVHSPLINTMSKKLEFMLNAQAALKDVDMHFEVLNMGVHDSPNSSWVYYVVPPLVEKYDVDLVLDLSSRAGYEDYFGRAITDQGIPAEKDDPEYALKPFKNRIPYGDAARIYEAGKRKGLIKDDQPLPSWVTLLDCGDPDIRNPQIDHSLRAISKIS